MFKKYIVDLKNEFRGYNGKSFSKDLMAGLTVAAVALPLALAFAVSSGADAASGLVTAIFAGLIIGVLSGASFQISGPTGAMAAILLTIAAKYGISAVMLAGLMSGIVLVIAGVLKIGRLVSIIPTPVITGFTSGIAIIIALGQIDNFFGTSSEGSSALLKILSYKDLGFNIQWQSLMFGALVVLIMVLFPKKLNAIIPSSLVGIIVALVINLIIYPDASNPGVTQVGDIPKTLLTENSLLKAGIDFSAIQGLIVPAISIAALGMVESLLCGASAGKMKDEKFDADRELIAQGIGNIVIPLFGGIPATAAIARTSVAIKSGGKTRVVSIVHSLVLLAAMFLLGDIMSRIPLAALAGVLMVTAVKMNDWKEIKQIFKQRFKSEIFLYLLTMIATVVFDLTVAIVIGVVLAMVLYIAKSANLTVTVQEVDDEKIAKKGCHGDHSEIRLAYLTGPLFFGNVGKLLEESEKIEDCGTIIFSMRAVPIIDSNAVHALEEIYDSFAKKNTRVIFCGLNPDLKTMFERSGLALKVTDANIFWDAIAAISDAEKV